MGETATNAMRVALALKRNGVKYIFGQSNPPSITLACDDIGVKQIGYRQENAGSYMAQGYSMSSNKVSVVTAQNGPAATLLVPGLAEALKSSIPIVAIVEEIERTNEEKNAFQELDHIELFKGVSKWVKKIPVQERIEDYIDRAFIAASSGRPGPVVLLCPKDIMNDTTEYSINDGRKESYGYFPLDRPVANYEDIENVAKLIANYENPFIYAGGGVMSSDAMKELRAIQEEFSVPVATTTMGKGSVDELHPLSIGPIGYYMGKRGVSTQLKSIVQNSDLILLVGNRTNQNGTDSWTLLPEGAKYIHIDIDPLEIGRNYESIRLLGDAKLTLQKLNEALSRQNLEKRNSRRKAIEDQIREGRERHNEIMTEYLKDDQKVKIESFLLELDKKLGDDHIIVSDASISSVWSANYIRATKKRRFLFPRGLAGLGWGLPMGMGAKIANPERKVFCLVGDGGFGHVWSELETCKRLGINVVVVVINNGILGYQKLGETALFGRYTNVCDFENVDHTKVAEAVGIKGLKISTNDEINDVIDEALNANESVLIDLLSDPENIPPVTLMDRMIND